MYSELENLSYNSDLFLKNGPIILSIIDLALENHPLLSCREGTSCLVPFSNLDPAV